MNEPDVLPIEIMINGTKRSTRNSKGLPIALEIKSIENFWNWFGDSTAVDDAGRPLVVFHSSTFGDISEFDPNVGVYGKAGYGFYFSNEEGANLFADYGDKFCASISAQGEIKKVNITPVYLKINSPLSLPHVDNLNSYLDTNQSFGVSKKYQKTPPVTAAPWIRQGYDGIVTSETTAKKVHKTQGLKILSQTDPKALRFPVYVVQDPCAIKSAIGNSGGFDPESKDICDRHLLTYMKSNQLVDNIIKEAAETNYRKDRSNQLGLTVM